MHISKRSRMIIAGVAFFGATLATVGIALHSAAAPNNPNYIYAATTEPINYTEVIETTVTSTVTEKATTTSTSTTTTTSTSETTSTATSETTSTTAKETTTTTTVATEPVETTTTTVEEPTYDYSWWPEEDGMHFSPSGWVVDWESYYTLCNCVAHEAGWHYIDTYHKALVVEVIYNRVNRSGLSVHDVVGSPNQFEGSGTYINITDGYSREVNDDVISAVAFYCSWPEIFDEGYYYFTGNHPDHQNHFRVNY